MLGSADPGLIYRLLRKRFGFLDWWPGESSDEILIGAVLTQQTSWRNVEKAISSLRDANALSVKAISSIDTKKLEKLIRSSGFYRQKAARLKKLCRHIISEYGSLRKFLSMDADKLRQELLSMEGIGQETADAIVLYAAGKPSFVIDAYTIRAMERIIGKGRRFSYTDLQGYFTERLPRDVELYKDMHAQFVELGKRYCFKTKPLCSECPLAGVCSYGKGSIPVRQRPAKYLNMSQCVKHNE